MESLNIFHGILYFFYPNHIKKVWYTINDILVYKGGDT